MRFIKRLLFILIILSTNYLTAQVYLHDFGTTTITTNPYTVAPGTLDPTLSNSSWSSSTGTFTSFAGASGEALSLSNSGGTPTLTLTFDIASGCTLDITGFSFWRRRSSTGAQNWDLSINGTSVGSGTVPTTGANTGLQAVSGMTGLTGTVTIEIDLSGATGTGTFRMDDFALFGSTSCGSQEINIGIPSPSSISVECTTDGTGTVDYTLVDVFDPTNDFTLELSDGTGSFSSPTSIGSLTDEDGDGTINYTIPANFPAGTYSVRIISNNPSVISDTTTLTITNNCFTTIDAINGGPFTVDCSTGTTDSGTIDYTTGSTYNAGNTFTVLLSDASGNFTNATTIGTVTSNTSGSISITLPDNLLSGSGYQIQIVSSDPVTTTSASSSFTITQSGSCIPPHLTSVIINSCQTGPCPEGDNEIVLGNTGDFSLEATPANIDLGYGTAATILTDNYTESLTTNPTTTALLNDSAGCPGLFVEGTGETMPPNSSFIIVNENICVDALVWSSLCGAGPIYVIYTNDGTWGSSGNFSNSASGIRYFDFNTTTTDGSTFNENYDFNSNDLTLHDDGDYVTFPSTGGSAVEYGNNGCTLSPVLLYSSLMKYYGWYRNSDSYLNWITSAENNTDYYEVFHSTSGSFWSSIGTTKGNGTTEEENEYRLVHDFPSPGVNYYKLTSVDFDGTTYQKGVIMIEAPINFIYFNNQLSLLELENKMDIEIYTVDGKLVGSYLNAKSIPFSYKGVFIVRDMKSLATQRISTF